MSLQKPFAVTPDIGGCTGAGHAQLAMKAPVVRLYALSDVGPGRPPVTVVWDEQT